MAGLEQCVGGELPLALPTVVEMTKVSAIIAENGVPLAHVLCVTQLGGLFRGSGPSCDALLGQMINHRCFRGAPDFELNGRMLALDISHYGWDVKNASLLSVSYILPGVYVWNVETKAYVLDQRTVEVAFRFPLISSNELDFGPVLKFLCRDKSAFIRDKVRDFNIFFLPEPNERVALF